MKHFQVGKNPKILRGYEKIDREPRFSLRKILFLIILFIAVGVIIYFMLFSDFFVIRNVVLKNETDTISAEEINQTVEPILREKFWYIFPRNNFFLFSPNRAEDEVLSKIPQIKDVSIKKRINGNLELTIEERAPIALLYADGVFYELDASGAVANISFFERTGMPKISSRSSEKFTLHSRAMERYMLDCFIELSNKFTQKTSIKSKEFYTPATVSQQVRIVTEEGFEVYFDSTKDVEKQIENLLAVLNQKVNKDKRSKIEYIDLSTSGWAYIK